VKRLRRALRRAAIGAVGLVAVTAALVALNGLVLAPRESPVLGLTASPPRALPSDEDGIELRVVSYNIAKAFAYRQRFRFKDPAVVRARLDAMAEAIRAVDADLVFLAEALHECPPCELSQVEYLAERIGAHAWLFGECYNIGLPWYRVSGGNAILSRLPLEPDVNLTLAGRRPFYVARNNRRALFGTIQVGNRTVLLGALHNDSRAKQTNTDQMRQILAFTAGRETLLAGDFNAWPDHASMALVRDSQRFTAVRSDQLTFPSNRPNRTIDFIVAPVGWELLEYRVLDTQASDHRPVFARFRCPPALCGSALAP
jgi:endonuclease/exonuclease/phosphatase family metal-dependent hydrolase